jgi:hypothetical protein
VHNLGVLPLGRVRAVLLCSLHDPVRSKYVVDIF